MLTDAYHETADWIDGDETGCHTVYSFILQQYMERLTEARDMSKLAEIFDFLEELLKDEDLYFEEVVSCSILEGFADVGDKPALLMPMMGQKTRERLQGLLDYKDKMDRQERERQNQKQAKH